VDVVEHHAVPITGCPTNVIHCRKTTTLNVVYPLVCTK
jgi:hypothetical protein